MGNYRSGTWSSDNAAAVTASDTAVLQDITRGIWVGGGTGTVKVRMASGEDCTFTGVAGVLLPIQVDKVYDTGTDATGIVALY